MAAEATPTTTTTVLLRVRRLARFVARRDEWTRHWGDPLADTGRNTHCGRPGHGWAGRLVGRAKRVEQVAILVLIGLVGISSRLFSVVRYESVIHEFDPWFNYRTTRELVNRGVYDFLNWFDDYSWYPLGRVVGGTVYPGLMVTSGFIYWVLHALNFPVDIRNVCVFLAPLFSWYGRPAGLTGKCSPPAWSAHLPPILSGARPQFQVHCHCDVLSDQGAEGLVGRPARRRLHWCGHTRAADSAVRFPVLTGPTHLLFLPNFRLAIAPGYISRSVAGSYDNEGVAIFALQVTFYLWLKAVRTGTVYWAAMAALGYFYMVGAWGGYVFIINIIPMHVLVLLLMGRYTTRLYVAYSTFFVIGTLSSMQVPFIGFQPVQTSEHMAALGTIAYRVSRRDPAA